MTTRFLITSNNHMADDVKTILCMVIGSDLVYPDTSFNYVACIVYKCQGRGQHKTNIPRCSRVETRKLREETTNLHQIYSNIMAVNTSSIYN